MRKKTKVWIAFISCILIACCLCVADRYTKIYFYRTGFGYTQINTDANAKKKNEFAERFDAKEDFSNYIEDLHIEWDYDYDELFDQDYAMVVFRCLGNDHDIISVRSVRMILNTVYINLNIGYSKKFVEVNQYRYVALAIKKSDLKADTKIKVVASYAGNVVYLE